MADEPMIADDEPRGVQRVCDLAVAATVERLQALEVLADKVRFCHDAQRAGHGLLAAAAWSEVVSALTALDKPTD